jgi:hypothetical protein
VSLNRGGELRTLDKDVLSDDLSNAIFKADEWRSQGAEVWIEDLNGNKVDEAALSKAAD